MKNLFNNISNEEKQRILEMHIDATSKQYLKEETIDPIMDCINKFKNNPKVYNFLMEKIECLKKLDLGCLITFDPELIDAGKKVLDCIKKAKKYPVKH
jgi:hypothetical protein